jgi:hypothetical protein
MQIFITCIIQHNLLLAEPDIPEEWYELCEEDIGIDLDADGLYGRDVSINEENRREKVKHSLLELFNAAPF